MLFDKHMNLHHAATHALGLLMQLYVDETKKKKEFGIEKRISDRPRSCDVVAFQDICVVSWHVCQSDLVYAISEA